MSNVRPRFKRQASHASCLEHHPERASAVRCAGCACARNTGCRRRFEFCASAQGGSRGRFRLSAPSTAIARSRQFAPAKVSSSIEALHVLNRSAKLSAGLMSVNHGGLASSLGIHLQVQLKRRLRGFVPPALVCFAIQIQSKGCGSPSVA